MGAAPISIPSTRPRVGLGEGCLASLLTLQLWIALLGVITGMVLALGGLPLLWGQPPLHDRLAGTRLQARL